MAKKLTSKEYDAMAQRLERMADGIGRHKTEEGFPARLDQKKRIAMRQTLEDLRETWETLITQAGKAYEAYLAHYKSCGAELAQDDDIVKGFYGKKNPTVRDFGTKALSTPKGRTKKAAKQ